MMTSDPSLRERLPKDDLMLDRRSGSHQLEVRALQVSPVPPHQRRSGPSMFWSLDLLEEDGAPNCSSELGAEVQNIF